MADRLKDKVALVVGAGSIGPGWGNGKATAAAFAREGAKVFCADINLAAAEETASDHQEGGLRRPRATSRCNEKRRSRSDGQGLPIGLWPDRHSRQQCRNCRSRRRRRNFRAGLGPRDGGQLEERLPHHEVRHPADGKAGRRLDHQHLVDCRDPLHRRAVLDLLREQGGAQPLNAHDCRSIRARRKFA